MATVQDLKRRVRSVRNTRKITKAMELVASARLRRAQARIEAMRPYADRMLQLMAGVARASVSMQRLPLLQRREPKTTADRRDHGRPRSRRRLQLADPAPGVRARARARGEGQAGPLGRRRAGRAARPSGSERFELCRRVHRLHRPPGLRDAQAIAHRGGRALHEGEVDRVVVVYNAVRVGARPEGHGAGGPAAVGATCSRPTTRSARRTRCAATSSSSRSPSRSSSGCSPSTSRPSSTAPCSSRRPPSTGPG